MVQFNNKIDVIIPLYNVPYNTLFQCLSSIAYQEIKDDIEVTIVDDASTENLNYIEAVKFFEKIINIKVIHCDVNGGPGVARQIGIDNTSNEFIAFIDADDIFNGTLALKMLRDGINSEDGLNQICLGIFDEVCPPAVEYGENIPFFKDHDEDLTWLFGKLYRRAYIEKYDIRFHPTSRANEDKGFNVLCCLYANEEERIRYVPARVYYWNINSNSITNKNNYKFNSNKNSSFYGYVENMIYAIKTVQEKDPENDNLHLCAANTMFYLYTYYLECEGLAPEYAEENLKWCKWYYQEIYSKIEAEIPSMIMTEMYNSALRDAYEENKYANFIPKTSFYDFMNKMK